VTKAGIAEATAKLLAEDSERGPAALADRIGTLAGEFDDVASRSQSATVEWLQGTRLPVSAVAVTCSTNVSSTAMTSPQPPGDRGRYSATLPSSRSRPSCCH
jgi:hypothetical protein